MTGGLKSTLVAAREALQRVLRPLGFRPSRVLAGRRFQFDPATDIGLELLLTHSFERGAIDVCLRHLPQNGVVIDVGANIGVHTVHFAQAVPKGLVLSFEPARRTFDFLSKNVSEWPNVVPLNCGLAETTALETFYVAEDDAYSGLKDTGRKNILKTETVACFRGDDVLPNLLSNRHIHLIKIDVEGLETSVLKGLRNTILEHRPVIFCEIFGGANSNPRPSETVDFVVGLGYRASVLHGSELVPAGLHDDRFYNYFFSPQ
jgi:FkbM family methyltransferase